MEETSATSAIINYLVGNRIIDEKTAESITAEASADDSSLGSVLINNGYFSKDDLLILLLGFYKSVIFF